MTEERTSHEKPEKWYVVPYALNGEGFTEWRARESAYKDEDNLIPGKQSLGPEQDCKYVEYES